MLSKGNNALDDNFVLSNSLVLLMSAACGIAVANLYYLQPLLSQIAQGFHVSETSIGTVAMLTQIGYAMGLFFLVPLGDVMERRLLITFMLICSAVMLLMVSFSTTIAILGIFTLAVGFTSIVPQMILPFAAHLADESKRGKVIGTVMSGLLIGILLSRTFSGIIGGLFGWRIVYRIAVCMIILLAVFLYIFLPKSPPRSNIRYGKLLSSIWELVKKYHVLREASFNGAMMFGTFSAFWTTLVFLLSTPHYNLGSKAAGMFGLVGVAGALAAPVVGRVADKRSPRFTVGIGMCLSTLSFICFWIFGYHMAGLIIGIMLLDIGTQAGQVSNQARVHALNPEARNRINAVFMVCYFIGGALGAFLASLAWGMFQWNGVCAVGLLFQIVAIIGYFKVKK